MKSVPSISRKCSGCQQFVSVDITDHSLLQCPQCQMKWGEIKEVSQLFDRCPVCACRQFYVHKDFNQAMGCLVMLVGIVFVPKTYGLSLPVVALIDWLLYRRVKDVVVCYKCLSEFRGLPIPERLKPFMHHIGAKYDR